LENIAEYIAIENRYICIKQFQSRAKALNKNKMEEENMGYMNKIMDYVKIGAVAVTLAAASLSG